jgi:alpha-L-rhamnosidase
MAYHLLTMKGTTSFENMWKDYGATTLWEVLPVDDSMGRESMNGRSHSHPMNSGFDEWFFRGIAGIVPDENAPGFRKIIFRPYFTAQLKNAEATCESPYGTIASKWQWKGKSFIWNIQIPANTTAVVYIPNSGNKGSLLVNGKAIDSLDLSADPDYPDFWVYRKIENGANRIEIEM